MKFLKNYGIRDEQINLIESLYDASVIAGFCEIKDNISIILDFLVEYGFHNIYEIIEANLLFLFNEPKKIIDKIGKYDKEKLLYVVSNDPKMFSKI